MGAIPPDDDPGWSFSPRILLFLVPGYRFFASRRNRSEQRDALEALRQVWLSFTAALVGFGVIILFTVPGSVGPAGPWVGALSALTAICLAVAEAFGRRSLDCTDPQKLAASYHARFFLRTAFSEAIALFAFVGTFIVGEWWLYWLFLPFALFGFARNAPTTKHLGDEQERMRAAGCQLSLVQALRNPPPAGDPAASPS